MAITSRIEAINRAHNTRTKAGSRNHSGHTAELERLDFDRALSTLYAYGLKDYTTSFNMETSGIRVHCLFVNNKQMILDVSDPVDAEFLRILEVHLKLST